MKKTKKQKVSTLSKVLFLGALVLSLVSVGSVVKAKDNSFVGWLYSLYSLEQSTPSTPALKGSEDVLGASSNRPIQYVYDYVNGLFVAGSQIFDSSANTTLPGTLAVTGNSTFTGSATFNGAVTGIATSSLSTLTVTGTSTLGIVTSSGAIYFNGALTQNGAATFASTIGITGTSTLGIVTSSGAFYLNGAVSLGTTLGVTGLSSLSGGTTLTGGDSRVAGFVQTGSIATFTNTSTATAANVCDNPLWVVTPVTSTAAITLPATTTLFADCMTTNGDIKMINLLSVNTSSVFAAGSGGTLLYSSSLTIAAGKGALLRVVRDSATTYSAMLINVAN